MQKCYETSKYGVVVSFHSLRSFIEFRDTFESESAKFPFISKNEYGNHGVRVAEFSFNNNGSRLSLVYNVPFYEHGDYVVTAEWLYELYAQPAGLCNIGDDVVTAEWLHELHAQPAGLCNITEHDLTQDIKPRETPELDAFLASFKIN